LCLYGAYQVTYPAALNGLQFLTGTFLKQPMQLKDGSLPVPTAPGLGVEVDEAAIRRESARTRFA
jgi:L-alanine-DL-glutamate epimerase-like enolase superfamily enzyme